MMRTPPTTSQVCVACPAWNMLKVKVIMHSSPGRFPEIPADVKPLGFDALPEQSLGVNA
jgi:hypothetical protein